MRRDAAANSAHWGLWGTVAWSALIAAVFVAAQTVVVALLASQVEASPSELERFFGSAEENGYLISLATLATTLACCTLIAIIVKLKRGARLADYLALQPVAAATLFNWVAVLAVFVAASDLLTWSLGRPIVPEFMSNTYATARPVWLFWLALIAAAPLFEEAFFRGFLFKSFAASFMGPVGAIMVSTLFWAVLHLQYDAYGIVTIFVLGLLLGAARAATGSLYVPLVLHALANLVATIETAIAVR
ncbi:MAG TPA: CPBP family intramembrane glutamic endopeptidase [Burkholderiales bacterium]|nr:CPBP family intramembrane glutamic endopeptidase [Burkholderiales bacterium]